MAADRCSRDARPAHPRRGRSGSSPTSRTPRGWAASRSSCRGTPTGYREWARVAQLYAGDQARQHLGAGGRTARCSCCSRTATCAGPYVIGCLYSPVDKPPESRDGVQRRPHAAHPVGLGDHASTRPRRTVELKTTSGASRAAGGEERRAHARGHVEDHASRPPRSSIEATGDGHRQRAPASRSTERARAEGGGQSWVHRRPGMTDAVTGADTHIVMVPVRHRLGADARSRAPVLRHAHLRTRRPT